LDTSPRDQIRADTSAQGSGDHSDEEDGDDESDARESDQDGSDADRDGGNEDDQEVEEEGEEGEQGEDEADGDEQPAHEEIVGDAETALEETEEAQVGADTLAISSSSPLPTLTPTDAGNRTPPNVADADEISEFEEPQHSPSKIVYLYSLWNSCRYRIQCASLEVEEKAVSAFVYNRVF
jgi:hypothetical protein